MYVGHLFLITARPNFHLASIPSALYHCVETEPPTPSALTMALLIPLPTLPPPLYVFPVASYVLLFLWFVLYSQLPVSHLPFFATSFVIVPVSHHCRPFISTIIHYYSRISVFSFMHVCQPLSVTHLIPSAYSCI